MESTNSTMIKIKPAKSTREYWLLKLVVLVVVAGQPGKGCKKRTPSQDLAGTAGTPAKMGKDGGPIFKR